ncbi:unnamed protein product [Arctia plantaginis]|uniref:Uncharacterized protein n=1 Tax=Arctia plantaginis TaxID=874455 RepID=A0A8S0YVQ9_ARCPL|nr:unnamed protein product [Arctia plantaginis]CAB3232317.1 unnamed protein product [Arctia plantaginis]
MSLFSSAGNRPLEVPSVTKEAMKFDVVLIEVKRIEWVEYPLCRLLDNNKHPDLNHANYPNLYAATLEWARRIKKVQRNYQGSKSLIDQALHMDVVKRVLKMTSVSSGTLQLTLDQKEWLKTKGYTIPEKTLADILENDSKRKPGTQTPALGPNRSLNERRSPEGRDH